MSEKLDGVRAYWDGSQLLTRNGHKINAPNWFVKNFPPFELDGELWLERDQFQSVVSIVRRKRPDDRWQSITYQIFEVPSQKGGLLKRLNVLQSYLKSVSIPHVTIIKQTVIQHHDEVKQALKKIIELKGEGLVLRQADSEYQTGRSNEAVKVKQKQDAECVVVGYTEGKGKYLGQTGALKCSVFLKDFSKLNTQKDRVIKIGSGLTDQLRKSSPPLGALVTFQYMGLTQKGLPRFPVFLRVRLDEDYNTNNAQK
jgi:DNA ligase-1